MSKLATLIGIISAVLANDQAAEASDRNLVLVCSVAPCWYDSQGRTIGKAIQGIDVWRSMKGQWYRMEIETTTFITGVDFYYNDAACSGPPLLWTGNPDANGLTEVLPYYAPFDGTVIWGPVGIPIEVTPKGFRYGSLTAACQAITGNPIVAHAAQIVDTTHFSPPFFIQ